jgi:hypothetical protein
MKIIKQHRIEVIRQALFKKLRRMMSKKNERTNFFKCFGDEDKVFTNNHIIDDFIDEYWVLNCPDTYSIEEINNQIYKFFH